MSYEPSQEQLQELGIMVFEAASELFDKMGYSGDFCVQSIGFNCIVFGGTNRVIWSPVNGFSLDVGYCSDKFIKAFVLATKVSK